MISSASLIAPLDVTRFVLAYVVLIIVPGYAIALLARPAAPRTERLALAIPCALGLVTVSGVVTALLHLSFDLPQYAVLAVPVTLAAIVVSWQRRKRRHERGWGAVVAPNPTADSDERRDRWWLAPLGVAAVTLGALGVIFAQETVPAGFDVLAHVSWIMQVMQAHVFPIALMSRHLSATANDGNGGFYPPTFHVATALVLGVARVPVYHGVFLSVVAVIAFLPAALFSYVRVATGSTRLAGLATLASLAFEPLPLFTQGLGLYPFVTSLLLVPALAIVLRDALGRGDRRSVALAALLGAGLFYTHPTEFVTVVLLGLAIIPSLLRDIGAWLRAVGYALVIAGVWFAAAFPALLAVRNTIVIGAQGEINSTHDFAPKALSSVGTGLDFYVQWVFGRNASYLLLLAVVAGIAWCLVKRRLISLALVQVAVSVLFIDSVSLDVFQPFYDISFPWALWERLAPTHYWITLPIAAVGIDATWASVRRLLRTTDRLFLAIAASPAVVLGLLLPFGVSAAITQAYAQARSIVAPSDLAALAWMSAHVPRTTVVANDGDVSNMATFDAPIDAGRWMPVLNGPQPLFWRDASGPGAVRDRFYLLRHIADVPLPARAAHFIARYHVGYVFYGAQVRPGATRHLDLARLLRDPHLRLVYSSVSTCGDNNVTASLTPMSAAACPAVASYVFALDGKPSLSTYR